ncbi:hypothetical protein XIS1_10006 [Xenorhabdus innexi]|uniref:Uncharacterized protein n=1 Tax=Xenorhabdus innexi TaxID=290109 RepID=A0A1N6MQB0_9GAMM|nr:hypothetical protein XIS1_10006 [Xenorhabdus innexi]
MGSIILVLAKNRKKLLYINKINVKVIIFIRFVCYGIYFIFISTGEEKIESMNDYLFLKIL